MSRKLDAAIAGAMGRGVVWRAKVKAKIKGMRPVHNYVDSDSANSHSQPYYTRTTAPVPKFSTDGNDMLQLDAEMRTRGWVISLHYFSKYLSGPTYSAVFSKPSDPLVSNSPPIKGEAETEPLARALAAYYALTGKEYQEPHEPHD